MSDPRKRELREVLLPGVDPEMIEDSYGGAAGDELGSGKFFGPESSAALAANLFGWFYHQPQRLPPLPGCEDLDFPATSVSLEAGLRLPWSGARRAWLGALVVTPAALIGIESRRFEPFRARTPPSWPDTYWQNVWGTDMEGYQRLRDRLRDEPAAFRHLDAAQLITQALALRTAVQREIAHLGKLAVLLYLYAEPARWPDGRLIEQEALDRHRAEIDAFGRIVSKDEVRFAACPYRRITLLWKMRSDAALTTHCARLEERFL